MSSRSEQICIRQYVKFDCLALRRYLTVLIVCAYLMKEYNWTAEKAVLHTYQMRRCACPNLGFMEQLFHYQNELGIKMTEELLPLEP